MTATGAVRPVRRQVLSKLVRYATVSGISTAISQTVLAVLVATTATTPARANVIATLAGVGPSFELNRRWVWGKHGRRSMSGELLPFALLSFSGLALSTVSVAIMADLVVDLSTTARTLSIQAANLAAFGAVWLVQFVLLDRVLFRSSRAVVDAVPRIERGQDVSCVR